MDQKDKINIIMEEYKTLRTEILARTGYGFQIAAVTAAALTWFFGQKLDSWLPWVGVGVVVLFVIWFSLVNLRDLWKAAARVREIEHEVNSRAGANLLVWERRFGAARMGFLAGVVSRIEPLPPSALPPLDSSYSDGSKP